MSIEKHLTLQPEDKWLTLCVLVTSADSPFANSLDTDQAQHNVGSDLDSNCLTRERSGSVVECLA